MRNLGDGTSPLPCTRKLISVKRSIVNVSRKEEMKDHMRLCAGCLFSMNAQKSRMANRRTIDEMPIAASSRAVGKPLRVSIKTRYGASRVLTPWMPRAVGICVDMMVILAAVTNAEIGIYGMNSMIHPRRSSPKKSSTAPESMLSVCATSWFENPDLPPSLTRLMTWPTSSEPTAVVYKS